MSGYLKYLELGWLGLLLVVFWAANFAVPVSVDEVLDVNSVVEI